MPICALDECNETFERTDRRVQLYCCTNHKLRDHKRRTRALQRETKKAQGQPYLATIQLCEVDGRAFTTDLIPQRGRPRKYDCQRCNEIAAILRSMNE